MYDRIWAFGKEKNRVIYIWWNEQHRSILGGVIAMSVIFGTKKEEPTKRTKPPTKYSEEARESMEREDKE